MKLRPSSGQARGVFISVEGPSGAGKSTIVHHLAQLLVGAGEDVHVTAEPSTGPIGVLCRELTETTTGHALACLYAGGLPGSGLAGIHHLHLPGVSPDGLRSCMGAAVCGVQLCGQLVT